MEKRIIEGKFIPTGKKSELWCCSACGFKGTTAVGKAHDGERGFWCINCHKKGEKSMLRTEMVEDTCWEKGHTEVKCCGRWIQCHRFTNTCAKCERDFNSSGQELAPREHWGEETGETAFDLRGL